MVVCVLLQHRYLHHVRAGPAAALSHLALWNFSPDLPTAPPPSCHACCATALNIICTFLQIHGVLLLLLLLLLLLRMCCLSCLGCRVIMYHCRPLCSQHSCACTLASTWASCEAAAAAVTGPGWHSSSNLLGRAQALQPMEQQQARLAVQVKLARRRLKQRRGSRRSGLDVCHTTIG
jgi:hypothetical protein